MFREYSIYLSFYFGSDSHHIYFLLTERGNACLCWAWRLAPSLFQRPVQPLPRRVIRERHRAAQRRRELSPQLLWSCAKPHTAFCRSMLSEHVCLDRVNIGPSLCWILNRRGIQRSLHRRTAPEYNLREDPQPSMFGPSVSSNVCTTQACATFCRRLWSIL